MKLLLISFLICSHAFAQPVNPNNTSENFFSAFRFADLKSKFKINYFSETLGPSMQKWDDNEIEDDGSKKREPVTMYHSLSIRYLLTDKFALYVGPRVSTAIGDRNDIRKNADPHVIMPDDWQFGAYYTFVKKSNFQYNQRLTHRAPFSTKSRNENIDSQIEWQHDFTYVATPALRIILWNNYRYYAFNSDATEERHRINFTTLFNYDFNDKWKAQFIHEWDMQHRNTNDSDNPKHRDFFYMKRYKNYFSLGAGYSPVPSFTIVPFVRLLDERNIRNETTIVGLWLLGKVL